MTKLHVENLSARFGTHTVLSGCTCSFSSSSITAILGSNGAGKTTLLRSIIGLGRSSGKVTIKEEEVEFSYPTAINFSYLPQHFDLGTGGSLTVLDFLQISYPIQLKVPSSELYQMIRLTAERCKMSHLLCQRLETLSGGERQLCLFASCLLHPSSLYVLDEPSNHLDREKRSIIADILRDECTHNNATILFATHDLLFAYLLADSLVTLEGGRVANQGKTNDISTSEFMKNRYGQLCSVAFTDGIIQEIPEHFILTCNRS